MTEKTIFADKLQSLVAMEVSQAMLEKNYDQIGSLLEILARSLGFTIAVATNGNGKAIDEMIAGAEAYAHDEAVRNSKIMKVFGGMKVKP